MVFCLFVCLLARPMVISADAMQDILAKKADVEREINEIIRLAGENKAKPADKRVPDRALELAIGRLATHLRSMDFRLQSLPPCTKTPAPPNLQPALDALRGLSVDPQLDQKKKETEKKIEEKKERIIFLDKVERSADMLVRLKIIAAMTGLLIGALPMPGKGAWDLANITDIALDRMGNNPISGVDGSPRPFPNKQEYKQYLRENIPGLQQHLNDLAKRNGAKSDKNGNLIVNESDMLLWSNNFLKEQAPKDAAITRREITDLEKELDSTKRKIEDAINKNQYLASLVTSVEDAIRDSKWIQNPGQFERMTAEIKVTVVDDKSGVSINTASVTVSPTAGTARTAANPFEYEGVANGTYTIEADATGYVKQSTSVAVTDCRVNSVNVRLKKKPIIRVAEIRDEGGNLLDNISVDLTNLGGGAGGGSGTYNQAPVEFVVEPSAFTVKATDPSGKYEAASENVNADAGETAEVRLVMKEKGIANFVIEVYDALSGQKIDPPPGSQEPGVSMEPLDGQPKPTGLPYAGNGERLFSRVQAGRYKVVTSFCGWETAPVTINVDAAELKSARVVRKVSVKPLKLDNFVGNVVEEGSSNHINDFKASLIGLGPRQGYRYDTVEGKHPDPTIHIFFGAFYIPGPIYSGHYRLEVTRACYLPMIRDQWWTFCGINPGWQSTYTPQIYQMKPTAEFEQARQQARGLIRQIKEQRDKAKKAADAVQKARQGMQDAPDIARQLIRELNALKTRYPSLEQDCTSASTSLTEINNNLQVITNAANQIVLLRETAKNLSGVACQLSEQAQKATDAQKAVNLQHNSQQFAEQAKKKADEATKLAQDTRKAYNAVEPKLAALDQLEKRASELKRDFAPISTKLKELRDRLTAAADASKSLAEADAAVAAATPLLNTVRQLLQSCATANSAKNLIEEAQIEHRAVVGEQTRARDENKLLQGFLTSAQTLTEQADKLGGEVEKMVTACDGLKIPSGVADAKANTDAVEAFAGVAQQSAKAAQECADKAKTSAAASQQLINQIQQAIGRCEYEEASKTAQQLKQSDPNNPWLSTNLSDLQRSAAAQQQARVLLRQGMEAIQNKNIDGAIASLRQARGVAGVPKCMLDQINKLLPELELRKNFISLTEKVEQATVNCDYKEAVRIIGEITRITPREQYITDWINTNVPKMAELENRERRALELVKQADAIAAKADTVSTTEPVDINKLNSLVQQAMNLLTQADQEAPKCMSRQQMEAIRVRLNGLAIRKKPAIAASIVLLIDTSGSMSENNKMMQAKEAARRAARQVSKTTEIAVLNFDGGCGGGAMQVAAPFTTDVNVLMAAIDRLRPGGGTPMYVSTAESIVYAQKNGRGTSRNLILMSDGGDSCRDEQAKAAAAIRSSNIPVSTIGFDVGTNQQAQGDLGNLATMTGGRTFSASAADPREIIRAFNLAMLPSLLKDLDFGSAGGAVSGYFSQAKTMVQQQNISGALMMLQQANQLAPNSANLNFNLSLLYEAEDQLIPAMNHANNYLRLAPNAIDSADVQNRIGEIQQELQKNPRVVMDSSGCRDTLVWAQTEREVAKRAKDAARLQAILEISIASQRGECDKARGLASGYKQRYR
jgi:Mg-chelatase subunit ChlD/uncharacterized coiled-coil DUF342 family protein